MKRALSNQKIKILGSIGLISFSALALITSTICWFSAARYVKPEGNFDIIHPEALASSYRIFEFDDDTKKGQQTDSLVLNSYDSFIQSRNINLCKIIEVTISTTEITPVSQIISSTITTSTEYAARSGDNYIISPYMSNIAEFKFCRLGYKVGDTYTYDIAGIDDSTNDDVFYKTAKAYFDSNSFTSYQFVANSEVETDKGVENVVKNDTVVCSDVELPANFSEVKFLVKYDYSVPLVNYFYDKCAGKIDIVNNQSAVSSKLDFTSDISEISINIGAN